MARNANQDHASIDALVGKPTWLYSQIAAGVCITNPATLDQTVRCNGDIASSPVIAFFIRIVVQAHDNADSPIKASPSNLSLTGMSTLGEYQAKTATPVTASSRPDASLLSNFSPRKGTANIAVNKGLKVIISDASPAAVHFIPYMKNA